MILVDSNILIGYLNGDIAVTEKLQRYKQNDHILFISTITVTEVLALTTLTPVEIKIIEIFLREFVTLSVTVDIAKQAAVLRRVQKLSMPDALIVSTALEHSLPLMTADIQLLKIPRLKYIS